MKEWAAQYGFTWKQVKNQIMNGRMSFKKEVAANAAAMGIEISK